MNNAITLIKNASYVIGCENDQHYIIPDGEIAYKGDTIIYVGHKYEGEVTHIMDANRAIISPGFINLHVHLGGCCMERNILPDTGTPYHYMSGLFRMKNPLIEIRPDIMYKFSIGELLSKGTTTVFQQGFGLDEAVIPLGESGIRAIYGQMCSDTRFCCENGYRATYAKKTEGIGIKNLEENMDLRKRYNGSYDGRMTIAIDLHAADTCSTELLDEAARYLKADDDLLCCIHAAQSINEYMYVLRTYGMPPADFLHQHGIYGPNVHYGHYYYPSNHTLNTVKYGDELSTIAKDGTNVIHCPLSFGRRGMFLDSFQKYHDMGINLGIGTDTMPLDIIMEMRYASVFCKIVEGGNPASANAGEVFNAVTINGAKAIHRPDLGRLQAGCKADIVFIDTQNFECTPIKDPIKTIVYNATGDNVVRTIINGVEVVADGLPKNMDMEKLVHEVQEAFDFTTMGYPEAHSMGYTIDEFSPMTYEVK